MLDAFTGMLRHLRRHYGTSSFPQCACPTQSGFHATFAAEKFGPRLVAGARSWLGHCIEGNKSRYDLCHGDAFSSEVVLNRQLHFAIEYSRRSDGSVVSVSDRRIGQTEERMVHGVENLGSKLRMLRFPDWKILVQ